MRASAVFPSRARNGAAAVPVRSTRGRIERGPLAPAGDGGRIVLIDNYDSFTENLAHLLAQLGASVSVVRNDAATSSGRLGSESR